MDTGCEVLDNYKIGSRDVDRCRCHGLDEISNGLGLLNDNGV